MLEKYMDMLGSMGE